MLTTLLRSLPRPIARIVHLGAGEGEDVPAYLEAGAGSVLLVEADAEAAAELAARHAAESRVEVLRAAVSADTAPRPFYRASVPYLSSLRPLDGLRALFPGLRVLSDEVVTPADPAALLGGRLGEGDEGGRLLVLETPQETLGILEALGEAGLLHRFDAVLLREWCEPFAAGAAPLEDIRKYLENNDFFSDLEPDPEDPDRPWLSARLNRALLERAREAQARIAAAETALAEARQSAETLTRERDAALGSVRDRDAALREAERQAEGLRGELAEAERRRQEAEAEAERRRQEMEAEAERRRQETEAEAGRIRAEAETAAAELEARLHRAQGDLSIAMRGQALAQADLRDLQTRYGEARAAQDRQAQLLTDLLPYLRRLLETTPVDDGLRQAIELEALPVESAPAAPGSDGGTGRKRRKKSRT